jgi:dethiobiotin synthetase
VRIEPDELVAGARSAGAGADALVVEGVGGLLVPLTPDFLVRDLARELDFPLVVAARPGLGTINHTLLTLEAARSGGLRVASVVLTPWPPAPGEVERSNLDTIARLGEVEVATLPAVAPPGASGPAPPDANGPAPLAAAGTALALDRWIAPARAVFPARAVG